MFEFFLSHNLLPFTGALLILFLILSFEVLMLLVGGLNLDSLIPHADHDFDVELSPTMDVISSWTLFGKVPVIIMLSLFLCGFSICGLLAQGVTNVVTGGTLPLWLALCIAIPGTFLFTRFVGGMIANLLPKEETYVVSQSQFLGQVAIINQGTARFDLPAEAKLKDGYSKTHYVRVRPETADDEFTENTPVLLLRKEEDVYIATRASYDANV